MACRRKIRRSAYRSCSLPLKGLKVVSGYGFGITGSVVEFELSRSVDIFCRGLRGDLGVDIMVQRLPLQGPRAGHFHFGQLKTGCGHLTEEV